MKAGCFAWHTGEMEEVIEDFIVLLFLLFSSTRYRRFALTSFLLLH